MIWSRYGRGAPPAEWGSPGPGYLVSAPLPPSRDKVGIRRKLELALGVLTIKLALGVTRAIACGVDARTPLQFAIVVGHLRNGHRSPEKQAVRIWGQWGCTFYD